MAMPTTNPTGTFSPVPPTIPGGAPPPAMPVMPMAPEAPPPVDPKARRKRLRRDSLKIDAQTVVDRVKRFYDDDRADRQDELDQRMQRYAKLRMWVEGKDWPWPNASDVPLPDMLEKSLRVQDTLHNAVLSQQPVISATPVDEASDAEKARKIDSLIQHQFFVENDGENIVGELAAHFVDEGVATAFIPWVRERRRVMDVRTFDPLPADQDAQMYFADLIRQTFPAAIAQPKGDGWDWRVTDTSDESGAAFDLAFYTRAGDDRVEMVAEREVLVHDGPTVIVMPWEDVFHPVRAANLQIPGPSNPRGAAHVILRDYPTIDEIRRLAKSGYYDLIPKEKLEQLGSAEGVLRGDGEMEQQKDTLAGSATTGATIDAEAHRRIVRLICFDIYDIDADGIAEDVVWWVLPEQQILCRAKHLTEMYPSNPPRRPLASESLIPIPGRRCGISMPELVEGIHDVNKIIIDQTIDANTLSLVPFGFYRAAGSIKPEIISMTPGEMYPVGDPSNDVNFPQIGNPQAIANALNIMTMLTGMEERLTTVGDFQLGRVPAGRASALRTSGGIAQLSAQGEARPERMLRRFLGLFAEIWAQIHEMNQRFLPEGKKWRIAGMPESGEDPYQKISQRSEVQGRYQFTFKANTINTNKQALADALKELLGVYVGPLTLQAGIAKADGVYRLLRDYGRARGVDPDLYIVAPSGDARLPPISAEQAVTEIMHDQTPMGRPSEAGGWQEHLAKLEGFVQSDRLGLLTPQQTDMLGQYSDVAKQQMFAERQQQLAMAAAGGGGPPGGQQPGQPGRPAEGPPPDPNAPQKAQPGKPMDMTMPGAGGGANGAGAMG